MYPWMEGLEIIHSEGKGLAVLTEPNNWAGLKSLFRHSFLCQSLLQATIAASRQASSPNTSTSQQTTTTQASVSKTAPSRTYQNLPSTPRLVLSLPCLFSMHTASKNAGKQQDADNFEDLGCCHYWWGLREPDKVFGWERPLSWKGRHGSLFAEALGKCCHGLEKDQDF